MQKKVNNNVSIYTIIIIIIIIGAVSFTDSHYGKPNKTVHLSNVDCSGLEDSLKECDASHIPPDKGSDLFHFVDVVGMSCKKQEPSISYNPTPLVVCVGVSCKTQEASISYNSTPLIVDNTRRVQINSGTIVGLVLLIVILITSVIINIL